MAFYIVVHHPDDPSPTRWANDWDDEGLLRAITTPRVVAARCSLARDQGERLFVHRCAWGGVPPIICCSVQVSEIQNIDRDTALVRFSEAKCVDAEPLMPAHQGQNSYDAPPPRGHE